MRRLHLKKEQLGLCTEYILKMQRGTKSLDIVGHVKNIGLGGRSQDGGGVGRGDHFLFYKFIERTTER